jgi:hypothetical protein
MAPPSDYQARNDSTWNKRCVGLDINVHLYQVGYLVQPRPEVGHVKLSGAFFDREKLLAESISFGKHARHVASGLHLHG